jgi:REP element-mobilizing transposase RayT
MVTRRCTQRQFLLRPDPVVEQVLIFCLALAARRHGIEVFCLVALSNHVHIGIRDPKGHLPRFMAHFDSLVARALNCHHGRGENFWAPGSYSAVTLEDEDAVLDKIVYMITNPIAANLVDLPAEWPGLLSLCQELGRRELVARRPTFFFRQPHEEGQDQDDTAAGRARRRYPPRDLTPAEVRLRLSRPPGFLELDDEALRALVARRVAARVDELHQQHRREGRGPALGRDAALLQRPTDTPGSSAPTFGLNPRLACRDRWRRVERLQGLVQFWRDHHEASVRFRAGERDVVFPAGTWLYRVVYGARCRPATTAA